MAINGAHIILYSKNAAADRAFLRKHFQFPEVDVGGGWLIFGLPPSEVAVHPSDENDLHEFYLLCDDIEDLVRSFRRKRVACTPIEELRWGSLVRLSLPGGGKIAIYEPKHARPATARPRKQAGERKASRKITTQRKR